MYFILLSLLNLIFVSLNLKTGSDIQCSLKMHFNLCFFLILSEFGKMDELQEPSSCITNTHSLCSSPPSSKTGSSPECNGVPENRTQLRVSESHGLQLLGVLRSFREHGLLFDFTIKVQEHSFPCHRCVLAACSDFFRYRFICLSLRMISLYVINIK